MDIRKKISLDEIRKKDMVNYLSLLGHEPTKIKNSDYWYLSPLRNERTASFKINRRLNCWYDHGIGRGGNIIDFAILYHNCTIGEFLRSFNEAFSFHQAPAATPKNAIEAENKIDIIHIRPISSLVLIRYLHKRNIRLELAEKYCNEVVFLLNNKTYFSLGFKNDSGGYELRNEFFKGSSSPKDVTIIKNNSKEVAVFEGFFDFLSLVSSVGKDAQNFNFCILNSLSFLEKSRAFLEQFETIHLYFDNDSAGIKSVNYLKSLDEKYKDESSLYRNYKDLNDWINHIGKRSRKQSLF